MNALGVWRSTLVASRVLLQSRALGMSVMPSSSVFSTWPHASPFSSSCASRSSQSQSGAASPPVVDASVAGKAQRRLIFNVPGDSERKLLKATTLNLDSVVLDLEDGVAQSRKSVARRQLSTVLSSPDKFDFGPTEVLVRINAIGSGLEEADLESLVPNVHRIDGIVLPKVESPAHVEQIYRFAQKHKHQSLKILAAIESARALVNLRAICEASAPIDALIFASEDLCADMGMTRTPEATELLWARSRLCTFAHAYGLQPIDMVCIEYTNMDQLRKECESGIQLGFEAKQAIHPGQIPVIYESFQPSAQVLLFASWIVEQSAQQESDGVGAFNVNNIVIDLPMIKWAEKILARSRS
mmetsp:Transcript_27039/g.67935  ORF Transcript_27039/g.67935 Transcript_27039/m.67935 type:complete len:356 (-) Transcript_27039:2016-3083(-)